MSNAHLDTPTGDSADLTALADLLATLERKDRDLTSLHDQYRAESGPEDPNTLRLAAMREGLRIALDDVRYDFDLAAARQKAAQDRAGYADMVANETVPLHHYSVALDEIYTLRQAMAYEAGGLAVHLEYKTFPKSRRTVAETQVERMRQAARGMAQHAYGGKSSQVLRHALREAGATETLTRSQFEDQHGLHAQRPEAKVEQ